MTKRYQINDAPYVMRARDATISGANLVLWFASGLQVVMPIAGLGEPWTAANKRRLKNVTLQLEGSCLWWPDLDDGFVLDEVLPTAFGMRPAAMLARNGRGKSTPKKAAAARHNGKMGGRPRKVVQHV
jgi:hypothetical protein